MFVNSRFGYNIYTPKNRKQVFIKMVHTKMYQVFYFHKYSKNINRKNKHSTVINKNIEQYDTKVKT